MVILLAWKTFIPLLVFLRVLVSS